MGSEVCADEIMNEANMSSLKCKQGWIGPATPEEKGEHSINSSPLTLSDENGLETPKETLFDSFAPASDKFLLAPHHRKYREDSRNHVVRRLDFFVEDFTTASAAAEIEIDIEIEEEERLFEIVYATIMDAIFAEQEQQPQPQPAAESPPPTPKSAPLLTGVADTCPAPPIKSARKQRFIDKELCRKLEF